MFLRWSWVAALPRELPRRGSSRQSPIDDHDWLPEGVDDWDKAAPFVGNATSRRSTSSLEDITSCATQEFGLLFL
jgi:hypothetical protein